MDERPDPAQQGSWQLIGFGLGLVAAYWILEAFLYVLIHGQTTFVDRLFSLNVNDLAVRLLVLAFFLIFGSHAQYTMAQRRRTDQALRETEGKYQTVLNSIGDGYFEIGEKGELVQANEAMCDILGKKRKSVHGKRITDFMNDASRLSFLGAVERMRDSGEPVKALEIVLIHQKDRPRYVEASLSPIEGSTDTDAAYRGIFRDTSERKRSEALHQEKLAAEASSRSKSEFLANMSHEIRTPLNSIIGLVELTLESELSTEQREDLMVVQSASYGLLSVINDILDFSKIEAGKLELDVTEFSLREFLAETVKIISGKAFEKHLEFAYFVDPDVEDRLLGDHSRLRQIVLNLLGNAIKFTDEGEIELRVSNESGVESEAVLHFSVRDTGIGIPDLKQERIFGAFDQADGSISRKFGGTGLGLAVSAQLVTLMGGSIWVKSEVNQGSTFHFTVRFARQVKSAQASDSETDVWGGVRALVIDDNRMQRDVIASMLEEMRMFCRGASTYEEGKEWILQGISQGVPFDVILFDHDASGDTLEGFVDWLRAAPEVKSKGILLVKRNQDHAAATRMEDRIAKILHKPVTPRELSRAIRFSLTRTDEEGKKKTGGEQEYKDPSLEGLRVLVAEDLAFNRKFISRLLDRWNFRFEIVDNGNAVLERVEAQDFDLVLMDVQMPGLDGLETTRVIRKKEKEARSGRLPIVAMTAHAMKGDREICIEAGMDEYVSKPVSSGMLYRAIQALFPEGAPERGTQGDAVKETREGFEVSKAELLTAFGGDEELLKELIGLFIDDCPQLLKKLQEGIDAEDADLVHRAAHDLKGLLRNFQAESAAELAHRLESAGRDGDFSHCDGIFERLAADVEAVGASLSKWM